MKTPVLTTRLQKAIDTACRLHLNQVRKADKDLPYISHPFSVAWILSRYTRDEVVIIAALLHDVLEDVPNYRYNDLEKDFGAEVAKVVRELSEDKDPSEKHGNRATWHYRKKKYLEELARHGEKTLMVCAADKMHNVRTMIASYERLGEDLWTKFNAPADRKIWFYEEILKVLRRRLDNPIVKDYEKALMELRNVLTVD